MICLKTIINDNVWSSLVPVVYIKYLVDASEAFISYSFDSAYIGLLLLLDAKMQQLQTFLFDRKWSDEKMRKLWFSFIILNYSGNCCTWCAIANGNMQMHFLLCLWYSLCIIYVFRFLCCALVKYFGQENKISCNMFLVL